MNNVMRYIQRIYFSTSSRGEIMVNYARSFSSTAAAPAATAAPVAPVASRGELPFMIFRTKSNQLPVYSDIRNGKTRQLTIVRKFKGDHEALIAELRKLVGADTPITKKAGYLQVKGKHVDKIKAWMTQAGY